MKIKEFEQYLLVYGEKIDHWPADKRAQAQKMIQLHPELGQSLQACKSFQQRIQNLPAPSFDEAALQRLYAIPAHYPQRQLWQQELGVYFQSWLKIPAKYSLAACLMLGILIGLSQQNNDFDNSETYPIESVFYLEDMYL